MRNFLNIALHSITIIARLLRPVGARSVVAENLAMKQQLTAINRSRQRAPNLTSSDWVILALCTLFIRSQRLAKIAVVRRPSTLHRFHRSLVQRKYSELFTPTSQRNPGPKGPSDEIINLVVELKQRNPTFG